MNPLEKKMTNDEKTTDICIDAISGVQYLYIEVNGWYLNGTIYTNFDKALGARRRPDDVIIQLYKKVLDPNA